MSFLSLDSGGQFTQVRGGQFGPVLTGHFIPVATGQYSRSLHKDDPLRFNFPKMVTCLTDEMEALIGSSQGNDVLGTFYEQHLYRKGASQYFTPWPICQLMASVLFTPNEKEQPSDEQRPLRILDSCAGSGRLLLAGSRVHGPSHEYYGIDIDHTCVKMTALNLFLNGVFHGEVMWADASRADDFRVSYKLSFLPFGIFRITEKEKSRLWYLHVSGFPSAYKANFDKEQWNSERKNNDSESNSASQLNLF